MVKKQRKVSRVAEIAVFIKSLFRDRALINCVESIRNYCNDLETRLYIANEGEISSKKENLFEQLETQGNKVLRIPMGTGASKARNMMLDELNEEEYVLRMDDDFEFTEETNIKKMKQVLEVNKEIGAVADLERQIGIGKGAFSGQISEWQGYLKWDGSVLMKELKPVKDFEYKEANNSKYALCDFSRNMLLMKRELLKDIRWDSSLKFGGEHLDFLLQIKQSNWKLAFTPESIHLHRDDLSSCIDSLTYNGEKTSNEESYELMKKKWGIESIEISRPMKSMLRAGLVKLVELVVNKFNSVEK